MNINELYTPCLIVDYEKLKTNINRMQKHIAGLGVTLRPHVKTAKSPDIAKMFEGGIHSPITVSTLKEAEYFLDAGFKDIIYAVSMVPEKLSRAKAIMENGADLKLIIDDSEIAKKISSFGGKKSMHFQSNDYTGVINKKIDFFLDRVRPTFYLDTPTLDQSFIKKLATKAGKPESI